MHDTRNRQLNPASGPRHPAAAPKDIDAARSRLGARSLLTFSITQRYAVEIDQWLGRQVDG
jgi:hypothetical protein